MKFRDFQRRQKAKEERIFLILLLIFFFLIRDVHHFCDVFRVLCIFFKKKAIDVPQLLGKPTTTTHREER